MSYIDVVEYKNKIHCWERGTDSKLRYTKHDVPYHLYMRDNTGKAKYKDIYGHPMRRIEFDSYKKLKEFADSRKDIIAESDVRPAYRHLIDHYVDADTSAPYNVSMFDIEVDFDLTEGKGYPSPKNPYGIINAFSIYDAMYDMYIMLIPAHLKGKVSLVDDREGKHVEIVWTKNEKDMLKTFSEYLDHVDITSGWNSQSFDFPYIMERAVMLFGETRALTLFSRNGVPAKKRDFVNDFGESVWEWEFPGRPHLDMMKLFKKFHPGEKKSFKLDSICEAELGEKKVDYTGDLGKLYREDPQTFFEYSLHDSRLLKFLDNKKQVIDLGMLMVRDMCSLPGDIFGSLKTIEMGIIKYARLKHGMVVPDKKSVEKSEQYAGAVVYDSIPGRHENIISVDLVSLYPKCMILLGFSPETFIYQCIGGYDDYVNIMNKNDDYGMIELEEVITGNVKEMSPSSVEKMVRDNGFTIAASGAIFNGEMGLIAGWLADNFELRKEYKKKMKECFSSGMESEGKRYDMYQNATKIGKLNAVYGAAGNEHFRFFDVRLAQAVTITSQVVSKAQCIYANEAIEMMKGDS